MKSPFPTSNYYRPPIGKQPYIIANIQLAVHMKARSRVWERTEAIKSERMTNKRLAGRRRSQEGVCNNGLNSEVEGQKGVPCE